MGFKSLHKYLKQLGSCVKLYTVFTILFSNQLYGDIITSAATSGGHEVPLYYNNTNNGGITVNVTLTGTDFTTFSANGNLRLYISFAENGVEPNPPAVNPWVNFTTAGIVAFNGSNNASIHFNYNDISDGSINGAPQDDGFKIKVYLQILTPTFATAEEDVSFDDHNGGTTDYLIYDRVDPWLSSFSYPKTNVAAANTSGNEYPFNTKEITFNLSDNLYDYISNNPTGPTYTSYIKYINVAPPNLEYTHQIVLNSGAITVNTSSSNLVHGQRYQIEY